MVPALRESRSQGPCIYEADASLTARAQITADIVRKAEQGGIKALCITVDAPQLGRREKDMRNKFSAAPPDVQKKVTNTHARTHAHAHTRTYTVIYTR